MPLLSTASKQEMEREEREVRLPLWCRMHSDCRGRAGAVTAEVELGALTAEVELGALTAEVELGALTAEVELGALTAEVELGALTAKVASP